MNTRMQQLAMRTDLLASRCLAMLTGHPMHRPLRACFGVELHQQAIQELRWPFVPCPAERVLPETAIHQMNLVACSRNADVEQATRFLHPLGSVVSPIRRGELALVQAQDDDDVVLRALRRVEREQIELLGRSITATELRLCRAEKNSVVFKSPMHALYVRSLVRKLWSGGHQHVEQFGA